MQDVARIVLAVDTEHLAQDVVEGLHSRLQPVGRVVPLPVGSPVLDGDHGSHEPKGSGGV